MRFLLLLACTGILLTCAMTTEPLPIIPAKQIQPWRENPRYWAWDGREPVLLLGAGSNDNLFQSANYAQELNLLAQTGGNYVRCTMSSRDTTNRWPFAFDTLLQRYDLERFDEEYWENFRGLLAHAASLDIVVQIELWDRFDYSRQPWTKNPFNPVLNGGYGEGLDSLLAAEYPLHPSRDVQPFFHSVPGLPRYRPELDRLRHYQEMLVEQLLSISLPYGNVLYCINNETTTPLQWGHYWADYIHRRAREEGTSAYVTDMFDDFYRPRHCPDCLAAFGDTTHYDFLDVSQINGRNFGRAHWDTLRTILYLAAAAPVRPINSTKVYGGGQSSWGSGTNADGIARFNRDVLGGLAAVRHHRPPSGNGLNAAAQSSIRAIRTLEQHVKFWDLTPAEDLLVGAPAVAFAARERGGKKILIYLPSAGTVEIRHGLEPQVPIRFTRVGFLGTKRSEVLQPPYRETFRVFTEEEKGGWMLVEPLE